jgi:CRP/FNR family cyclic AMP-dependent transcriptional regulator
MVMLNQAISKQIDTFFSNFQAFSFKTGEQLIRSGEQVEWIYYLKSGIVKQTSTSVVGQEVTITFYKSGAFFPLIWAVNNNPVPYDFYAVTNGHGWRAPKTKVINFLQQNPQPTFDLCLRLLSGLEGMSRKVAYALQATAQVRICEALITLAYRFATQLDSADHQLTELSFPLSHQDLANITGLTRETVTRELKILKEQGLVIVKDQYFSIPSLPALEHLLT